MIVYANDNGATTISAIDPEAQFTLVQRDDLAELARDVSARLQRALGQIPTEEPASHPA